MVDLARRPVGIPAWTELVEWIVEGNSPAEPDWLELKEAVSSKRDWASIAKYILGAVNRLPETAASHLEGAALLLLGVRNDGTAAGIKAVDPAVAEQGLSPYLGTDGPSWELRNIVIGSAAVNVAVFEVQAPEQGRIFICGKTGEGIRSGAVYVRKQGKTEEAGFEEMRERLSRLHAASQPAIDLAVDFRGVAYRVDFSSLDEDCRRHIQLQVDAYRSRHLPGRTPDGPFSIALPPPFGYKDPEVYITRWQADQELHWPERRDLLISALADAVQVVVSNRVKAVPLVQPRMVLTLHLAQGKNWESGSSVKRDQVFPSPSDNELGSAYARMSAFQHIRPFNATPTMEWRNTDASTLECVLTPESIRPGPGWVSEPDELVIITTDPTATKIRATWHATFHGIDQEFTGTAFLPVVSLLPDNDRE